MHIAVSSGAITKNAPTIGIACCAAFGLAS
jgi:hypothetical protein